MAALGVQAEVLDSGCCGLAGDFGFERGHYEVSQACGERVLFPPSAPTAPPPSSPTATAAAPRSASPPTATPPTWPTWPPPSSPRHLGKVLLVEEAELERAVVSHQLLDGGACSAVIHP